jgi:hypothetical protein
MNSNDSFQAIADLDLDPIKVKLMHLESGEGWSLDKANAVEFEYRRFLYLMKIFPSEATAPLFDVDTFWHYHILDTMKYAVDCEHVFGYFLHHFPYIGLRGEADLEAHQRVGERMKELYEQTFGEDYVRSAAAMESAGTEAAFSSAATKTAFSSRAPATAFSSAAVKTAFSSAAVKTAFSSRAPASAFSSATTKTAFSSAAVKTAFSSRAPASAFSSAAVKTAFSSRAPATAFSSATVSGADAAPATAFSSAAVSTEQSRFYTERPVLATRS